MTNMEDSVRMVAIVNSFNRLNLLQEAITSLLAALSTLNVHGVVIVFDAGSKDGSKEWLETTCRQAEGRMHVIHASAEDDSSFSAGVNRACDEAIARFPNVEFLLLFETDNWIAGGGALQRAMDLLRGTPELGAVGFTVRRHSGEPCAFGCRFPTLLQFILGQQLTQWLNLDNPKLSVNRKPKEGYTRCDIVFTSPLLIRREAWEKTSGMDASAFPFSDCDLDWAWRLKNLGWHMGVIASDDVVHDNRETASAWSSTRVLHFHRARLKLLRRYIGQQVSYIKPLLLVRHICEFVLLAVMVLFKRRPVCSLEKRWLLILRVFSDYEAA